MAGNSTQKNEGVTTYAVFRNDAHMLAVIMGLEEPELRELPGNVHGDDGEAKKSETRIPTIVSKTVETAKQPVVRMPRTLE